MSAKFDPIVRMLPISQINVMNPRERGRTKFSQIKANIAKLGLKKPITVVHVEGKNGDARYNLVCGQGRLEAYVALGQKEIPAILVECDKEELMIMSLAENLARRQHSTIELVRQIQVLKMEGYNHGEIARKTDLAPNYVRGILQLLAKGEDRLIQAVERGQLPVSIAVTIATSDDKSVQRALQEAYEKNDLRGKALLRARRLIESRRANGKNVRGGPRKAAPTPVTSSELLKAFEEETAKQRMTVQKAKLCETRLLFVVSAVKQLFRDESLRNLMRAEGLDMLPKYLADQIEGSQTSHA